MWNAAKAQVNIRSMTGLRSSKRHRCFLDPLFRLVDASRGDEAREAVIGLDEQSRILFVVRIEVHGKFIRIISARKATFQERKDHDF